MESWCVAKNATNNRASGSDRNGNKPDSAPFSSHARDIIIKVWFEKAEQSNVSWKINDARVPEISLKKLLRRCTAQPQKKKL